MAEKVTVHAVKSFKKDKAAEKTVPVEAHVVKQTSSRAELGDGMYMMTYYFKKGPYGEYIAEDYRDATHFERAVYDADNNFIGSTIGEITRTVKW